MLITSLIAATAAATSKWLITGKIMATVGTGLLTAAPAMEGLKNKGGANNA